MRSRKQQRGRERITTKRCQRQTNVRKWINSRGEKRNKKKPNTQLIRKAHSTIPVPLYNEMEPNLPGDTFWSPTSSSQVWPHFGWGDNLNCDGSCKLHPCFGRFDLRLALAAQAPFFRGIAPVADTVSHCSVITYCLIYAAPLTTGSKIQRAHFPGSAHLEVSLRGVSLLVGGSEGREACQCEKFSVRVFHQPLKVLLTHPVTLTVNLSFTGPLSFIPLCACACEVLWSCSAVKCAFLKEIRRRLTFKVSNWASSLSALYWCHITSKEICLGVKGV